MYLFGKNRSTCLLYTSENEYDEVNCALSGVLKLVRENVMRFRDIVLMTRDLPSYQNILESAFEKYGIPYFIDSRFDVENLPPVRYLLNLLEVVVSRLQTDSILNLLKCTLVPYCLEEISELENYVYLWGIDGSKSVSYTHLDVYKRQNLTGFPFAAAAKIAIGVTEIRLLMMGIPYSVSISSPTLTRFCARRVTFS